MKNQKQILSNTRGEREGWQPGMEDSLAKAPSLPFPIWAAYLVAANVIITSSWFHQESHWQVHLYYKVTIRCRIDRKATLVRSDTKIVSKRPNSILHKFLLEHQNEWDSDLGTENIIIT